MTRSLWFRLTALLTLCLVASYLLGPLAQMTLNANLMPGFERLGDRSFGTFDDLALLHAEDLLINSLRRDANGALLIEPTQKLRAYVEENPTFRYASFDGLQCEPAVGSDREVVAVIVKISQCPGSGDFLLAGEAAGSTKGYYSSFDSRVGRVTMAFFGYRFHWRDLVDYAADQFQSLLGGYFGPMLLTIILVSALGVRRGLAPLKQAAQRLEAIDMNALDSRLAVDDLPAEVAPFAEAVNRALARVDAGVTQQKRFVANAAHELRTPLAVLRARVEAPEEPSFKSDLKRDVSRIGAIVEQLLASARLGGSDADMAQRIDLTDLAWRIVADYALLCLDRDRRIELEECDESVFVIGDRRAIESVVANLIDNALRAEPAGGTVLVRVGDDATLEVVDHGEGVASGDREAIFEPFWRKSNATPGTGLGLAIARDLMTKLSGRIFVEDTPGGGATFKLLFPKVASGDHSVLQVRALTRDV